MSYHTRCDWCGTWLPHDADQAQLTTTIYHRKGRSRLEGQWAEEAQPARHFCAPPKAETDRDGRDRAGLVPEPEYVSCYDRAIAAITGEKLTDPGLGMEWRLMPVDREPGPAEAAKPKSNSPDYTPPQNPDELTLFGGKMITRELAQVLRQLRPGQKFILPDAGIVSLEQVARMSDADLLGMYGVGRKMVGELRDAIRRRNPGLALVRDAFGVIVHGVYDLDESDPARKQLLMALEPLTEALAEEAGPERQLEALVRKEG